MKIPLTEPVSPRYIHINHTTNKVHLMVPVVGGQEISTDNTCKATVALREFFDGGALRELTAYKEALAFDIGLLEPDREPRLGKEVRLAQIEAYIDAVSAMRFSFSDAITSFLRQPSNLYSIQLRPQAQDSQSRVVNPVFYVNRTNDAAGTPLSPLYNAMHSIFATTVIEAKAPRTRLTMAVLDALPMEPSFEDIQRVLEEQGLSLFGLRIDFTRLTDGTPATKEVIDKLMYFEGETTEEEYIDALLDACALEVWETLSTPPFYSIPAATSAHKQTERLSILMQFFLANLNVYCKARGISGRNFGVILDASTDLSNDLVSVVSTALTKGEDVEGAICNFCQANAGAFDLSRDINADDLTSIRQTFERTYRTVTATAENPHMDDFMILDKDAIGDVAKFVTHQGSICVNFAEIIDPTAASIAPDYFAGIRADFSTHPAEVPHRNDCVAGEADVDIESLMNDLSEEQFERLPSATKEACRAHPSFYLGYFLQNVAKGRQDEAETILTATLANTQTLLRTTATFTDYSGRTFNCTACEYAYWAKDTHMFRMLERYMDDETKAEMLTRIDAIEADGLSFQQNGQEHRSANFDFTPLKEAYHRYLDGYNVWHDAGNWDAINAAWRDIGKAQRNVPAHVAQEYCRPGRSFNHRPEFNEKTLPRTLTFYNSTIGFVDSWLPLKASHAGLGVDFALIRATRRGPGGALALVQGPDCKGVQLDLVAVSRLDEVRTADLTLLREHLNPPVASSMSV